MLIHVALSGGRLSGLWLPAGSDIRRHRQSHKVAWEHFFSCSSAARSHWVAHPVPNAWLLSNPSPGKRYTCLVPSYLKASCSLPPPLYRQTLYDQMSLLGAPGSQLEPLAGGCLFSWLSFSLFHAFDGHSVGIYGYTRPVQVSLQGRSKTWVLAYNRLSHSGEEVGGTVRGL